jgi:hypothetical protein
MAYIQAYQPTGDSTAYLERDPAGAPQNPVWHGTDYFFIPDRQGSTLALVDPAGARKDWRLYPHVVVLRQL